MQPGKEKAQNVPYCYRLMSDERSKAGGAKTSVLPSDKIRGRKFYFNR